MINLRFIILALVFWVALALVLMGVFGAKHDIKTFKGNYSPSYSGSDLDLLREYSFS